MTNPLIFLNMVLFFNLNLAFDYTVKADSDKNQSANQIIFDHTLQNLSSLNSVHSLAVNMSSDQAKIKNKTLIRKFEKNETLIPIFTLNQNALIKEPKYHTINVQLISALNQNNKTDDFLNETEENKKELSESGEHRKIDFFLIYFLVLPIGFIVCYRIICKNLKTIKDNFKSFKFFRYKNF